ncbi:MAG: phosphoglucosamine mutase [Opitutaceae bacterium]|nr:phosphoglucosamine mutase [Opitutaceae bacterium]
MTRKYFGTDGVRGPYGGPVMNEEFAERLGEAAARWLRTKGRVVIGRDTRYSGPLLEQAVARGLATAGAYPASLGVLPTPAVARAVRTTGAVLGVVITASHNPAADNGIKFFGPAGMKLTDDQELEIERLLPSPVVSPHRETEATLDERLGRPAMDDYVAAARTVLPPAALAGWRVVVDTANGAACTTTPPVLRALGATVIGIGDAPDGRNINAGVGTEHPEQLAARVRAENARLGIAHDGDGDRCLLCDERGEVLDGDELLTILGTHALEQGRLVKKTLVVTVQSNLGVDAAIAAAGGRVLRTAVGDRYVIEGMVLEGATLGGESSGHIICSDLSPTGDGLMAALKAIEVMLATGKPLSELRRRLKKFPQLTAALKVREKKPLETLPQLGATTRALERELGDHGRVLVRYSGTEPKLRLLIEGPSDESVRSGLARLEAATRADLDVVG